MHLHYDAPKKHTKQFVCACRPLGVVSCVETRSGGKWVAWGAAQPLWDLDVNHLLPASRILPLLAIVTASPCTFSFSH